MDLLGYQNLTGGEFFLSAGFFLNLLQLHTLHASVLGASTTRYPAGITQCSLNSWPQLQNTLARASRTIHRAPMMVINAIEVTKVGMTRLVGSSRLAPN